MQSIGLVFKKEEMTIVSLRQGISEIYLDGYRFLPFLDFKEDEKEGAILHNLERFFKKYRAGKYNLFIALPSDVALLQFLHLPLSVEENLRTTIGYEMDRHTPFSFDDVYFDCHIVNRFPEGNLLYVMLVTIKRDIIDYYLNLLKKINVKPRGIEITTTALFNVFQRAKTQSESVVDTKRVKKKDGWKSQALNIFKIPGINKKVEKPEGSSSVDFLVEYFNNSYEINMVSEDCLYYSKVFSANTTQHIDRHLQEIYSNGMKAVIHLPCGRGKQSDYKFFLSGKEMDKGYIDYAPEDIKPDFSIMQDLPIKIDRENEGSIASVLPLLSVPVGLALKGLVRTPLDINFVPLPLRQKKKKSKKKIMGVVVVILLLCLGVSYFVNNIREMKIRHEILDEQLRELKRQVVSIEELQSDAERIEQFSGAIKKIKKTDVSKIKLLEELTSIIPDDIWLTEFRYKAGEKKVKLSGYAVSASELIPILEESEMFEKVKFTSPITTERGRNKERFRLEMLVSSGKK